MNRWGRHILAVSVSGLACNLAVDTSRLNDGNCGDGRKACDGVCVSLTDPRYGCSSASCAPCAFVNSQSVCAPSGSCSIAACVGTFRDCDGKEDTGCETDISFDPLHCGDCKASACTTPRGRPGCRGGTCATAACDPGFGDCNADPADGCETDVRSNDGNCGRCGNACTAPLACLAGSCK